METAEFLEDIVAGFGSQYMVPEATALSIDELAECYRASDQYKDIVRIITGDRVKHIYWVESEPGLGLSLKTPLNNNPSNYKPSTETGKLVLQTSKLMNSFNFSKIKFILQQRLFEFQIINKSMLGCRISGYQNLYQVCASRRHSEYRESPGWRCSHGSVHKWRGVIISCFGTTENAA